MLKQLLTSLTFFVFLGTINAAEEPLSRKSVAPSTGSEVLYVTKEGVFAIPIDRSIRNNPFAILQD